MKLTGGTDLGETLLVRRAVRLVLLRDVAARRDVVRFVTFVFVDGLFDNALLLRIRLTHFVGAPHERHSRQENTSDVGEPKACSCLRYFVSAHPALNIRYCANVSRETKDFSCGILVSGGARRD
jgi:hypothetical protein